MVGGDRGEAGRVCLGFIKFCARAHQEVMAERSIALLHRCGCTGANRRTCLIWPARELSVSAVPARAWAFLRQRRSRRALSLSNTKAASLRPSRPINLRPEAAAISSRSTAVGRSTERAERTSDVTQIIRACLMPRSTRYATRSSYAPSRTSEQAPRLPTIRPRLSHQCHHTAWLQMRQVPEETSRCAREGTRQKPTNPGQRHRRIRSVPTDSIWTFQIGSLVSDSCTATEQPLLNNLVASARS